MLQTVDLKLMTWNLYLGGDISRVLNVKPELLPRRTQQLWDKVKASDYTERVELIADNIAKHQPDVLALQELFCWTLIERKGLQAPTEDVVYDYLALLQAALAKRQCDYFVAVHSQGVNLVLPLKANLDVRLQDSVALLLRAQPKDSPLAALSWENARQARFTQNLRVDMDGEPLYISRGWAGVDLRYGDGLLRVVTTHMEYFDDKVRNQQAHELITVACGVHGSRIVLGDFNSRPSSDVAQTFYQNGYSDAWEEQQLNSGLSSGQDEDLKNKVDENYERLDWILLRGQIQALGTQQVGWRETDRTSTGLWASDHCGLVSTVRARFEGRSVRPDPEDLDTKPVEVVRKLFDYFVKQDIAAMVDLFHPDAYLSFPGDPDILPWAGVFRGAGFTRFVAYVLSTIEYQEYRIKDIWGNGERVVATSRERCRVLANNRIFENDLVAVIRVKDGLIVEFLEYSDTGLMERALLKSKSATPKQVY